MNPAASVVLEARKKFNLHMEDELLDYKHNHPISIESCANTLLKIFGNVIENPTEPKYRQVKAGSNAFKNSVAMVKGGEHLMLLAGWKEKVVEMQKHWVFEGEPGTHRFSILEECMEVLQKALHTIHEKADRKRREQGGKSDLEKQRREQVLLAIQDDKIDRKIRSETMPHIGPAVAQPLGARQAGGSSSQHEEMMDDGDD